VKLVADENVDGVIVERLREDGHEVSWIAEAAPATSDPRVLEMARSQAAVLVTADRDFGELVFRQGLASYGVLLIRLHGLLPDEKARRISAAVRAHSAALPRAFTVVTPSSIRIRRK
jgi:predicted nuclease of predicted toxin-antitoxin system